MVLVRDPAESIGEVKGEVLFLGIEHERELVAILDQFDQVLVLPVLLGLETGLAHLHVHVRLAELVTEHLEGPGYVFLIENSPGPA